MHPPYLKAGDTMGILSTARKTDTVAIQKAARIIESFGYKVKLAPNLFAAAHQFAGTDAERIADMHTLLKDPEVKAIICARGGYGTSRMVDKVDWSLLEKQPKWIGGFSDVTTILCHLHRKGIESLHCSMAALFDTEDPCKKRSIESLFLLLEGGTFRLEAPAHPFNRSGQASGQIIGGNLSILNHLIGTPSDPEYSGKILFIEDLDEYLYHVDRMMVQLKRSGKLAKLAGLVVGGMSDMNDNSTPFGKTAYEIIKEHTAEYAYPVAFELPIGHEALNLAVPVGRNVLLQVNEEGAQLSELPIF